MSKNLNNQIVTQRQLRVGELVKKILVKFSLWMKQKSHI